MTERPKSEATPTGSRAADRLLANKDRILTLWEQRVREEILAAKEASHPVLIDTMPAILRQIAEALSPKHPRRTATEGTTLAEEHGGERARVTRFAMEDIIAEYSLLRAVLFELLEASDPLTPGERNTLNASIDQIIIKACAAYSLVQAGFRERYLATVTHDLRSPLSAAKANVGLILRKPAGEQVVRWAVRASDSLDRIDRMLQDMLDAMRAQAGARLQLLLEECDLVEVVRQSLEQLEAEHGERFILAAPEPVRGYFDAKALRRAMENLVNNAVKYGVAERPITVTVRQAHDRALLMVHNHGAHIPPNDQETLFRAFHRTREAEAGIKRGWGLGLAQARGVAEAHGGSIGVDSLPERGTTFTIDIPRDSRPLQQAPTTGG